MSLPTWLLLAAGWLGGYPVVARLVPTWPLSARLAAGLAFGLVLQGLATLTCARLWGVHALTLLAGALLAWLPALAMPGSLRKAARWRWPQASRATLRGGALFLLGAALLVPVAARGIVRLEDGGWGTGVSHNLGDLPFHLALISGFAHGENLPPEHPELAGAALSYPYLVDWLAALPVALGDDPLDVLHVHTAVLLLVTLALLAHWGHSFTGAPAAAWLVPALVLLDGGLGFVGLIEDLWTRPESAARVLLELGRDFTIADDRGLRWGNALTTLLLPQRAWLLGLPLLLLVMTLCWQGVQEQVEAGAGRRLWCAAGVCAGLLPLAHAHGYLLACGLLLACALGFRLRAAWLALGLAVLVGLPQLALLLQQTDVRAGRFLAWHLGWDRGDLDPVTFWLWNTGVLLPLLGLALGWRRPRLLTERQKRFYAPLGALFVLANLLRLSPWIWDNVKVLFPWYVASVPLVASALIASARQGAAGRCVAALLFVSLTLSGALDVWRVGSAQIELALFDADALAFASAVRRVTPAHTRIVHAPRHDAPTLLSGRPSVLGYPGHIWSQGLDAGSREQDIARVYLGEDPPARLTQAYGASVLVTGPAERDAYGALPDALRDLPIVARAGPFELRRLAPTR